MREVSAHVSRGRVSARGERGASVVARDRAAEPSGTDRGDRRGVRVRAACERAALSRSATALAGESGVRPRSPRSEGRIDRVEAASFIRMRRSRHARRRHEDTALKRSEHPALAQGHTVAVPFERRAPVCCPPARIRGSAGRRRPSSPAPSRVEGQSKLPERTQNWIKLGGNVTWGVVRTCPLMGGCHGS